MAVLFLLLLLQRHEYPNTLSNLFPLAGVIVMPCYSLDNVTDNRYAGGL